MVAMRAWRGRRRRALRRKPVVYTFWKWQPPTATWCSICIFERRGIHISFNERKQQHIMEVGDWRGSC
eukprot:9687117-Prorocentrum_lima.AAC.1